MLKAGRSCVSITSLIFFVGVLGRGHRFKCPTSSGTVSHDSSYRLNWICHNGTNWATQGTCDFGYIYNDRTRICEWPNADIATFANDVAGRNLSTALPATVWPLAGAFFKDQEAKSQADKGEQDNRIKPAGAETILAISDKETSELPIKDRNSSVSRYELLLSRWQNLRKVWKLKKVMELNKETTPSVHDTVNKTETTTLPSQTSSTSSAIPLQRIRPTRKPLVDADSNCNKSRCKLPDCYCDVLNIPNGLPPKKTPQIVMVTWDDSVNGGNFEFLKRVFARNRTNLNGCPITGTVFLSHKWTDYKMVQELYKRGHEIASHSLSHTDCAKCNETIWRNEILGQALMVHANGVNRSDIVGMRAPFLAIGGDAMFHMLWSNGFLYDSSIPSPQTDPPMWPYTLDNPIPHSCYGTCPKYRYPGLWEVPMTGVVGLGGIKCSMYDACVMPEDTEGLTKIFWDNFLKHYSTNRAPYLLSAHAAWFWGKWNRQNALSNFMDKALKLGDVWFVSIYQALKWMQQPTPLENLYSFQPWQCAKPEI
ncbi:hypothetical protein RvY_16273-2 [Ramazzottius varieornatus]|uniref:NodB homology domain-containing protein n=1 Tax=Ramazzottius varieornatus TaxID=947166 RepID=A0A1D1W4D3_RAMVA|nr:hypothetical protein RvY_16273-2 [Ramazzottius varieornatus]